MHAHSTHWHDECPQPTASYKECPRPQTGPATLPPTLLAAILYRDSSSRRMKSGSLFCWNWPANTQSRSPANPRHVSISVTKQIGDGVMAASASPRARCSTRTANQITHLPSLACAVQTSCTAAERGAGMWNESRSRCSRTATANWSRTKAAANTKPCRAYRILAACSLTTACITSSRVDASIAALCLQRGGRQGEWRSARAGGHRLRAVVRACGGMADDYCLLAHIRGVGRGREPCSVDGKRKVPWQRGTSRQLHRFHPSTAVWQRKGGMREAKGGGSPSRTLHPSRRLEGGVGPLPGKDGAMQSLSGDLSLCSPRRRSATISKLSQVM
jgi:hypothetical protein